MRKTFWGVLFAAGLFSSGCSSRGGGPEAGTVNLLIESAPTNFDPRIGTDAQSQNLHGLLFDSLVAYDDKMNIVPDLAERWETHDPLTYVFHLRRGVRFHDGRPLASADVKFTFDSILSGAVKTVKRGAFRMVESVEAPDEGTVVFHLREPYASFTWNLVRPGIGIVPRGSGEEVAQHPIGTGPFRFVSAVPDEEIVLERNPEYFGWAVPKANADSSSSRRDATGIPGNERLGSEEQGGEIERVRIRIVPDALVRALELRKGTADVAAINSLTPDTVVTLAREHDIAVEERPGTELAYIAFNCDDPILAHREVRQALAYATDRETLIHYLLRGEAREASSLLPPNHWAYEADVRNYDYNPVRADQLLDAAGFRRGPNGVRFHLTLKTSTEEASRLLGTAIANEWRRVGVALELRPLEFATFYSDITRGSFELYTARWVGGNNDPDMFEYVFSSKRVPPDGANRGHYRNPQLDELLDRARVEMDRGKRKRIFSEVQKIVAEDEPYLDLWYRNNMCVHRRRLTGVVLPPVGDYEFLVEARLQ